MDGFLSKLIFKIYIYFIKSEKMQGEQWVFLLYFQPFESEVNLKQNIIAAIKPYLELRQDQIELFSKDEKYRAILKVGSKKGSVLDSLKEFKIGETIANIKRYYYDHQLYINKIPKDLPLKEINQYFNNFGEVQNVVLIPSLKNNGKYSHCYVKFSSPKSVDKVLLVRKLQICGREIRALRTFRLGENQSTDAKLSLRVQGTPQSIDVLQNQINQYFQTLGQLRERTRLQIHDQRTLAGVLTFTCQQFAQTALSKFDPAVISKGIYKIDLKHWIHPSEEGGKVFVPGLSKYYDQNQIKSVFQVYGEILDLSLVLNRANTLFNAIITYTKISSAKTLLAEYLFNEELKKLFHGKPHIEFYLNAGERKNYNNYKNKGQPQKIFQNNPVFQPFQTSPPPQFFNPYQPTQFVPQYMPRPNQK